MVKPDCDVAGLEELTRLRNRIAHELVNATESERVTQRYLSKELEMNTYTERIDRLRREREQQTSQVSRPASKCR